MRPYSSAPCVIGLGGGTGLWQPHTAAKTKPNNQTENGCKRRMNPPPSVASQKSQSLRRRVSSAQIALPGALRSRTPDACLDDSLNRLRNRVQKIVTRGLFKRIDRGQKIGP